MMAPPIDPAAVLAAWPDDDAVRESPELAVEQIHELAAEVVALRRQIEATGRVHEQWYGRAQRAEAALARSNEQAPELGIATSNSKPHLEVLGSSTVPGVEIGTVVVLDLDSVRNGHVPWPGDADDGTCSCCGMPHPCVTRRLAGELEQARAEIARLSGRLGELAFAEMLAGQSCENAKHTDWFVDSEYNHRCPWCAIEKAEAQVAAVRAWHERIIREPGQTSEQRRTSWEFIAALDGAAPTHEFVPDGGAGITCVHGLQQGDVGWIACFRLASDPVHAPAAGAE